MVVADGWRTGPETTARARIPAVSLLSSPRYCRTVKKPLSVREDQAKCEFVVNDLATGQQRRLGCAIRRATQGIRIGQENGGQENEGQENEGQENGGQENEERAYLPVLHFPVIQGPEPSVLPRGTTWIFNKTRRK